MRTDKFREDREITNIVDLIDYLPSQVLLLSGGCLLTYLSACLPTRYLHLYTGYLIYIS